MNTGGYQIINLENRPLTLEVGMVYEGIYDKIERTTKAILLTGLNVDGVEKRDEFCTVTITGSNFVLHTQSYDITINDNDVVTCTEATGGGSISTNDLVLDLLSETTVDLGMSISDYEEFFMNGRIFIDRGLAGKSVVIGGYFGAGLTLIAMSYEKKYWFVRMPMDSTTITFTEEG